MKWENKGHFWIGNDSHIRPQKWPNKITVTHHFNHVFWVLKRTVH